METFKIILQAGRLLAITLIIGHFVFDQLSSLYALVTGIALLLPSQYYLSAFKAALHMAARRGDVIAITELLEIGYDINAQNENRWTPLHWAAWKGHTEAVKLLLKNGAEPELKDRVCKTPADVARDEGHHLIVDMLKNANYQSKIRGKSNA